MLIIEFCFYWCLEEQVLREKGYIPQLQCKRFKFKDDNEPQIKVTTSDEQDQCQIGFQPSNAMVLTNNVSPVMLQSW